MSMVNANKGPEGQIQTIKKTQPKNGHMASKHRRYVQFKRVPKRTTQSSTLTTRAPLTPFPLSPFTQDPHKPSTYEPHI